MAEAYTFLEKNISPEINDWAWKNVHTIEYANIPWSFTFFKPLFHREVPIGGNTNTPKVSKVSFKKFNDIKTFKTTHTPVYKQVGSFGD